MMKLVVNNQPDMQPRELRDKSGWYVLVQWGNVPSEQVGGFPSEEEAAQWIKDSSAGWLAGRMDRHEDR